MSPPTAAPRGPFRRKVVAMAAAAALLAGSVYAGWIWVKSRTPIRSVAVMPFADQTSNKDHEGFCNGLTAGVIDSLARVPGLRVIGRDSVFREQNPAQFGV